MSKKASKAKSRLLQPDLNRYRPAELSRKVRPAQFHHLATVRSTNSYALHLRRLGKLYAPALLVATQQTGGRGRAENGWWSRRGCITATWVFPVETQYAPHQLPLITGLALRGACVEMSGDTSIAIKWPNDLLWHDRKLAGILCERADGADFVGIGLNLNVSPGQWPSHLATGAVSLSTIAGRDFDINDAIHLITDHLRRYLTGRTSQPFAAILQEFRSCDALLGREITADIPGEASSQHGTCEGIDRDGALLLRCNGRTRRLIAASITLHQR